MGRQVRTRRATMRRGDIVRFIGSENAMCCLLRTLILVSGGFWLLLAGPAWAEVGEMPGPCTVGCDIPIGPGGVHGRSSSRPGNPKVVGPCISRCTADKVYC